MDLSKCIDLCNENRNCKFVQLSKHGEGKIACRMYSSCYLSRVSNWIGTTYSKDGTCPGKKLLRRLNITSNKNVKYYNNNITFVSLETILVSYLVCFSLVRKTCAQKYKIVAEANSDDKKCTTLCSEDDNCQFAFLDKAGECITYKSCDQTRNSLQIGTTFAKSGNKCPGVDLFY